MHHYQLLFLPGVTEITLDIPNRSTDIDLRANGMKVFIFCENFVDTFVSLFNTVKEYLGGLGTHGLLPLFKG